MSISSRRIYSDVYKRSVGSLYCQRLVRRLCSFTPCRQLDEAGEQQRQVIKSDNRNAWWQALSQVWKPLHPISGDEHIENLSRVVRKL